MSIFIIKFFNKYYLNLVYPYKSSHHNPRACEIELGCDEMARCVFDAENNRKICECMNGYDGDGKNCHPYKPEVMHKQVSEESEEDRDNLVNTQDIVHPQNYNFGNDEHGNYFISDIIFLFFLFVIYIIFL